MWLSHKLDILIASRRIKIVNNKWASKRIVECALGEDRVASVHTGSHNL